MSPRRAQHVTAASPSPATVEARQADVAQILAAATPVRPSLAHDVHCRDAAQLREVVRLLRLHRRTMAEVEIVLRQQGSEQNVLLRDVSATGAGLRGAQGLVVGDTVELVVSGFGTVEAEVRWQRHDRCGVVFLATCSSAAPAPAGDTAAASGIAASWLSRPVPAVIERIGRFWTAFAVARTRRAEGRERRMMERACRKNGFAWLAEEE